jgi:hypothetical protein
MTTSQPTSFSMRHLRNRWDALCITLLLRMRATASAMVNFWAALPALGASRGARRGPLVVDL